MKAVKFGKRAAGLNIPDIYRQYLFERIQKILLGHLAGSHQLALVTHLVFHVAVSNPERVLYFYGLIGDFVVFAVGRELLGSEYLPLVLRCA